MKEIKNREEIVEQLVRLLMQFDKDCNQYQTDVYLYYDEKTQTAILDTFVNVGGNSWLNDDHYTIYTDNEHYDSWLDYYQSDSEIAYCLDMSVEQLESETRKYFDYDDDEEVGEYKIREYILCNSDYEETLCAEYDEYIEDMQPEYAQKAVEIIDNFLEELEREENYI